MKWLALVVLAGCGGTSRGSAPSCPQPQDHSVELGLQEDIKKVAGCPVLPGIVIRTGAGLDLAPLGELEELRGDLTIGPTVDLDEAAFNNLLRVTGTVRIASNGALRGLFLPRLEHAGRVEIENNAVLMSISMPRLATVDGAVVIADNGSLEMLSAPLLDTVGKELVIAGHGKLALLEMGKLSRAEAVRIEGNPQLPPDVVATLTSKSSLAQPPTP